MIGFGMYPREQKISLTLLLRIGREENSYVIYLGKVMKKIGFDKVFSVQNKRKILF
jgi:hypothetical protein